MNPHWENVTNTSVLFWWGTDSTRSKQIVSVLYTWVEENQLIKMTGGKKSRVTITEFQFRSFEFFLLSLLLVVVHWNVTKINMRAFQKIHSMKAQFAALMPNSSGLRRRLINIYFSDLDVFQVEITSSKDMNMVR